MSFEPGGIADKLGNRYEENWVAKQLLMLLSERVKSIVVEPGKPDGVDLTIGKESYHHHQCKARVPGGGNWTVSKLKQVLKAAKSSFEDDAGCNFSLVTPVTAQDLDDVFQMARHSDVPETFFADQLAKVGRKKREYVNAIATVLDYDLGKKTGRAGLHSFLKRFSVELYPDTEEARQDAEVLAGLLMTGNRASALAALRIFFTTAGAYRKTITAPDIWRYLKECHGIYPKDIRQDGRVAPQLERCRLDYSAALRPLLLENNLLSRQSTADCFQAIQAQEKIVLLCGPAGVGKSSVLLELLDQLGAKRIPALPIRLDIYDDVRSSDELGQRMGLPYSPVKCLTELARDSMSVLLLDQLDALRWHTDSAKPLQAVRQMLDEIGTIRRAGRNVAVVVSCRSSDFEGDVQLRSLLTGPSGSDRIRRVDVGLLTEEQLRSIIGDDWRRLHPRARQILRLPQNLQMWLELRKEAGPGEFSTVSQLISRFWSFKREKLSRVVDQVKVDELVKELIWYFERSGRVSARAMIFARFSLEKDALISHHVLVEEKERIRFSHQSYLDHLIAEEVLRRVLVADETLIDWLGQRKQQYLSVRGQLQVVLELLADLEPERLKREVIEILGAQNIRFHLKHLVLQVLGQLQRIPDGFTELVISYLADGYWRDHVYYTVLRFHSPWVEALSNSGHLVTWVDAEDETIQERGIDLIASVAQELPDLIADVAERVLSRSDEWRKRLGQRLGFRVEDDSERVFGIRLQLARLGYPPGSVNWRELAKKNVDYALRLLVTLCLRELEEPPEDAVRRNDRIVSDHDVEQILIVALESPLKTWDTLFPALVGMVLDRTDKADPKANIWFKEPSILWDSPPLPKVLLRLIVDAGRKLATENPKQLVQRVADWENHPSIVLRHVVQAVYAHLSQDYADKAVAWLIADDSRLETGVESGESYWGPAETLLQRQSPFCSLGVLRAAERVVVNYHHPKEVEHARWMLKRTIHGRSFFWGSAQYRLLKAMEFSRLSDDAKALLRVLTRRFENTEESDFLVGFRMGMGGVVGSKLAGKVYKLSDREWLRIINCDDRIKIPLDGFASNWVKTGPDAIAESSVMQFSRSVGHAAECFPERFARLALRIPLTVHPRYISALINGFRLSSAPPTLQESEQASWAPVGIDLLEAVIDRFAEVEDVGVKFSISDVMACRPGLDWSNAAVERLLSYVLGVTDGPGTVEDEPLSAQSAEQGVFGKLPSHALLTLGELVSKEQGRFEVVKPWIDRIRRTNNPYVQAAIQRFLHTVANIDTHLAVATFLYIADRNLAMAATRDGANFLWHMLRRFPEELEPTVLEMFRAENAFTAEAGTTLLTSAYLNYGVFKEEVQECLHGSCSQLKCLAKTATRLVHHPEMGERARELLVPLFDDPHADVRAELRDLFSAHLLVDGHYDKAFLETWLSSRTFHEQTCRFADQLSALGEDLYVLRDLVLRVSDSVLLAASQQCAEEKFLWHHAESAIKMLISLYHLSVERSDQPLQSECLDRIDALFETRTIRNTSLVDS